MAHDPLSPSEALRTRIGLALVCLTAFALVYSVVIVAQILAGLWFAAFVAGLYPLYRVLVVLDSLADAAQRIAAVREREADAADVDTRDAAGREREREGSWGTE